MRAALGIFADVAEDVGELEGDAGVFGEGFGARIGVAKDADADEAHNGGDVVAITAQVFEGGKGGVGVPGTRLCGSIGGGGFRSGRHKGRLEIHGGALNELIEKLQWNLKTRLRVRKGREYRIVGGLAGGGAMPVSEPGGQVRTALFARARFIVGEVVGVAHEGVDGADGITLVFGKSEEGVIEILRLTAGNLPAFFVSRVEFEIGKATAGRHAGLRETDLRRAGSRRTARIGQDRRRRRIRYKGSRQGSVASREAAASSLLKFQHLPRE